MNLTFVQQAYFTLREGYLDLVSAELFNDGRVNFRGRGPAIGHGRPRFDGNIDGTVRERGDANAGFRRLQHARIGRKYLAQQGQNLGHVAAVGHADGEVELADLAVVMEDFADDFAVGNHHDGHVRVGQKGGEQFNVPDLAVNAGQLDVFTDATGLGENDSQSV